MRESPSITRRQALAALGVASTGAAGYVLGVRTADTVPDWLASRRCSPSLLATSPTDWSFPRHDRANTGTAPARAGPDWPLDEAWEQEWPVPDLHEIGSLVVADGVVVVPLVYPGSTVVGLSVADGRVLWRQPADRVQHDHVIAASGSAFVEADVPDTDVGFAARSLGDGEALWTDSFSSHVPQTLAGGRLLVFERDPDRSSDARRFAVTALDARTGVECWRTVHDGWIFDVAVADGRVLVPTREHGILALDPSTGEQQWRSSVGGDAAAVRDGRVISQQFPGDLRSFSLADGELEWHVRSDYFLSGGRDEEGNEYARPDFTLGAVTSNAIVYTLDVHSEYPSRVQARDLDSGDLLWDVGPEPRPTAHHAYSRPIVVGEDVIVVRYARNEGPSVSLLRLDLATGAERNRVTYDDERVYRPVVADGYLLVPTDDGLIAYR